MSLIRGGVLPIQVHGGPAFVRHDHASLNSLPLRLARHAPGEARCRTQTIPYRSIQGDRNIDLGSQLEGPNLSRFAVTATSGLDITFSELTRVSGLLADVFGSVDSPSVQRGYQIRLVAALQGRIMQEKSGFLMFTATAKSMSGSMIVGVLTVSPGLGAAGAAGYERFGGLKCYSICNMAVHKGFRRQGVAKTLLTKVEQRFATEHGCYLILSVGRANIEAMRLYKSCGFVLDPEWEDPRWLESVQRERDVVERRVLMYKAL